MLSSNIERIVLLDFIHRLVSQEQTKLRNFRKLEKLNNSSILFILETPDDG